MATRSMTPSKRERRSKSLPIRHETEREWHPIDLIRRDMSRIFDDFFSGFSLWPISDQPISLDTFMPQVDMTEDDNAIRVNVEVPGIDEKDIEISLTNDTLTIKGEKKEEAEHKDEECYCSERSYGSFTRVLPIPTDVDVDKVEATYNKGVLNITLPKLAGGKRARRRIEIKSH